MPRATDSSPLRRLGTALAAVALVAACDDGPARTAPASGSVAPTRTTPAATPTVKEFPTPTSPPKTAAEPARFRVAAAMQTVRLLAGRIGPREATSDAYREAAIEVQRRFEAVGFTVRRQHLRVPAGVSWGVPVDAGRTWNVVAEPAGFDPSQPYQIVGAHLDTVPQAPGAEDNASGTAVMLELARLAGERTPRLPVVFVAFGAEEPRGDGDALHHFGSRAYVAAMAAAERRNLTGMVSMDRVGVGDVVPVCTATSGAPTDRSRLLRTAARADIPAAACVNASSDHWSFQRAGLPGTRVGGTSYAAYHSAADLPGVVSPSQLGRVGRLMWAWLRR